MLEPSKCFHDMLEWMLKLGSEYVIHDYRRSPGFMLAKPSDQPISWYASVFFPSSPMFECTPSQRR